MTINLNDLNLPLSPETPVVSQDVALGVEKFSVADLRALRQDLLQAGVDTFQAAEIVSNFLTGRGYGCSTPDARSAASSIEVPGVTTEHMQAALEHIGRVM